MRRLSIFIPTTLAAIVLVFAGTPLALATQIVYRTPQQMGQQSSLVVQGEVTGVRSYWNEKRTKIFTETLVQVDQAYKGTNPGTVRVVQLGGTVGNVRVTVAGALQWKRGEEVLLFLEQATDEAYQVSGFSQGKFNIERDPVTGEAFVRRQALEGVEILLAPQADQQVSPSRSFNVPLKRFIDDALNLR